MQGQRCCISDWQIDTRRPSWSDVAVHMEYLDRLWIESQSLPCWASHLLPFSPSLSTARCEKGFPQTCFMGITEWTQEVGIKRLSLEWEISSFVVVFLSNKITLLGSGLLRLLIARNLLTTKKCNFISHNNYYKLYFSFTHFFLWKEGSYYKTA